MEETTTYVVEVPVNKQCARCGRVFPYTEFAPNSSGLTSSCRECRGMASHASKWRKKKGVEYTRFCIECNGDISDRGPSSKRCQMCQDSRTRELGLLRAEKRQALKNKKPRSDMTA